MRLVHTGARGAALLTALVILALASATITALVAERNSQLDQQISLTARTAAEDYLRAGLDWVRVLLAADGKSSVPDHLQEAWAQPQIANASATALVSVQIVDAQGRLDLNSLVDLDGKRQAKPLERYRVLLTQLQLPANLADSLSDWLDRDLEGAFEDSYYLSQTAATLGKTAGWRAANRPIVSLTELTLIAGYTPQVITTLSPHISALPVQTIERKVNANTASSEVLVAVCGSKDAADRLTGARNKKPLDSDSAIQTALTPLPLCAAIGVSSAWFYANLVVTEGAYSLPATALVYRNPKQDNVSGPVIIAADLLAQ